ncbi:hypothetical protein ACWEP3_30115, partial [Streptomyces albidoflavus]
YGGGRLGGQRVAEDGDVGAADAARPGPRVPGSGAGLVGMRERAELLGGSFAAGPVDGAGTGGERRWEVRAVLPLGEAEGGPRETVSGQADDDDLGDTRER